MNSAYWNNIAEQYRDFYIDDKIAQYKSREYIKIINRWGENYNGNILITDLFDAAFGNKDYLSFLTNNKSRVYGIDISNIITEKAKINNTALSGYVVCDVKKLPFKNSTFSLVISPSTLDHFSEIDKALKEINRLLKKNRILIIALNNKHNHLFNLNLFIYSFFNLFGFYVHKSYTFQETERLLQVSGFIMEEKTTIMHIPFLFPTVHIIANKIGFVFLKKITSKLLLFFENYGKDIRRTHKRTGWWITLKARKW